MSITPRRLYSRFGNGAGVLRVGRRRSFITPVPRGWIRHAPAPHLSEVSGSSMNFPTTERIASIAIKSAESIAAIAIAGTHLVVQGTNKINGT